MLVITLRVMSARLLITRSVMTPLRYSPPPVQNLPAVRDLAAQMASGGWSSTCSAEEGRAHIPNIFRSAGELFGLGSEAAAKQTADGKGGREAAFPERGGSGPGDLASVFLDFSDRGGDLLHVGLFTQEHGLGEADVFGTEDVVLRTGPVLLPAVERLLRI